MSNEQPVPIAYIFQPNTDKNSDEAGKNIIYGARVLDNSRKNIEHFLGNPLSESYIKVGSSPHLTQDGTVCEYDLGDHTISIDYDHTDIVRLLCVMRLDLLGMQLETDWFEALSFMGFSVRRQADRKTTANAGGPLLNLRWKDYNGYGITVIPKAGTTIITEVRIYRPIDLGKLDPDSQPTMFSI